MIEGIPSGTIYDQIAGGGGGYGNPIEREKDSILKDVKNEVVSKNQAKEVYGINIEDNT
ncbi:MAG: hypothetical protein HOG73_05360 [Candidatus Marinimicrobia bacterium]|nr:hypothetical protein [Candidatus Neomarinimicrobiota bacterium]